MEVVNVDLVDFTLEIERYRLHGMWVGAMVEMATLDL